MSEIEIKVGGYVLVASRYSFAVGKVSKVTAKFVWHAEPNWHRAWRADKSAVVFAGDEAACTRLREQLVSSDARCRQEVNSAHDRRRERDAKLIADARAAVEERPASAPAKNVET